MARRYHAEANTSWTPLGALHNAASDRTGWHCSSLFCTGLRRAALRFTVLCDVALCTTMRQHAVLDIIGPHHVASCSMRVITVSSDKGGVGKSALSGTLAVLLARGRRVVLIDADSRGDATSNLGIRGVDPRNDRGRGLARALLEHTDIPLVPTTWIEPGSNDGIRFERERLQLAVGGRDFANVSREMTRGALDPTSAFAKIREIDTDVVIVDCPPGDAEIQRAAFAIADDVLVPTKTDHNSLRGLADIVSVIVEARRDNLQLRLAGVALYDVAASAVAVRRDSRAQVEEALNGAAPLFGCVVRASVEYAKCTEAGLTIVEWAEYLRAVEGVTSARAASALAWDFQCLLDEVLATWQ